MCCINRHREGAWWHCYAASLHTQTGAGLKACSLFLAHATVVHSLQLTPIARPPPPAGLYVGTFGPHGPELLQVSRQVEEGQEWAVATKLTGDPNVPAGTVSWKALIGRANRLPGARGWQRLLWLGTGCAVWGAAACVRLRAC